VELGRTKTKQLMPPEESNIGSEIPPHRLSTKDMLRLLGFTFQFGENNIEYWKYRRSCSLNPPLLGVFKDDKHNDSRTVLLNAQNVIFRAGEIYEKERILNAIEK